MENFFYDTEHNFKIVDCSAKTRKIGEEDKKFLRLVAETKCTPRLINSYCDSYGDVIYIPGLGKDPSILHSFKTIDFGEQSVFQLRLNIVGSIFDGASITGLKVKYSEEFKALAVFTFEIPESNSAGIGDIFSLFKEDDTPIIISKIQTELDFEKKEEKKTKKVEASAK